MRFNLFNQNGRPWGQPTACLLSLALLMAACWTEENPTIVSGERQNNVAQYVAANNLTLLNAALSRTGSAATLAGTGPFTLFAPTDDAFRAAGFADAAAINAAPVATLSNILLYHVVSGTAVTSSAIPTAQTAYPTSVSGNAPIYVTKASSGAVSVNGARVTQADGQASNGVVHVIDQVLLPPSGNVLQVAQADTSLSLLVAAAQRGGAAVVTALSSTTALTVFAPTNAAFRTAGYSSTTAINAIPVATLTGILTNHVVAGARAYSPTLTNGATVSTFGGGSLTVTVGTGTAVSIASRGNAGTAANVLSNTVTAGAPFVPNRDISATNGVLHKIDRLLLP